MNFQIVYVARNPKDVAVSWYIQNKAFITQGYIGDFPQFWNYFKNDLSEFIIVNFSFKREKRNCKKNFSFKFNFSFIFTCKNFL